MSGDTIQDIIETEKQIHLTLQDEKQKASLWVAEQKKKIETELQERLTEFNVTGCRHRDAVQKEAQSLSEQHITTTKNQIKRIENIAEATLQKIIEKYLPTILPGSS